MKHVALCTTWFHSIRFDKTSQWLWRRSYLVGVLFGDDVCLTRLSGDVLISDVLSRRKFFLYFRTCVAATSPPVDVPYMASPSSRRQSLVCSPISPIQRRMVRLLLILLLVWGVISALTHTDNIHCVIDFPTMCVSSQPFYHWFSMGVMAAT